MMYGSTTVFAYHKKCKREVEEVIAELPILLEIEFGSAVWSWFSDDARREAQGFKWQNGVGLIAVEDDLEPWETLNDGVLKTQEEDDITTAFTNLSFVQSAGKNHFNDSQSVTTRDLAVLKDAQGCRRFDSKETVEVSTESTTTITAESILTDSAKPEMFTAFTQLSEEEQRLFLANAMDSLKNSSPYPVGTTDPSSTQPSPPTDLIESESVDGAYGDHDSTLDFLSPSSSDTSLDSSSISDGPVCPSKSWNKPIHQSQKSKAVAGFSKPGQQP